VLVQRRDALLTAALAGAGVRLLVRDEIGGGQEAMLEVVDSQVRCFRVCHRTQVAGDLQAAVVGLLDRRAQRGTRDVHVRLEGGRPHVGPIPHLTPCVVGVLERVHLQKRIRPVQVRRGGVDCGPRLLPCVDQALQVQVHDAVDVSTGAQRGHATGEVEADEAVSQLPVDAWPGRVVEVLVNHHETRDDRPPREVEDGCPVRRLHRVRVSHRRDIAAAHHDGLVLAGRSAGSIDHADVGQRDHGRLDLDELAHRVAELRRLRAKLERRRQGKEGTQGVADHETLKVCLTSQKSTMGTGTLRGLSP
jgi:hypothetical protein